MQTHRLLRHPAFPLVHQLFPVRTLDTFYHDLYVFLYLLCRSCGLKNLEIYKTSTSCFSSLDAGLGTTHLRGNLALRAGGRRHFQKIIQFGSRTLSWVCESHQLGIERSAFILQLLKRRYNLNRLNRSTAERENVRLQELPWYWRRRLGVESVVPSDLAQSLPSRTQSHPKRTWTPFFHSVIGFCNFPPSKSQIEKTMRI